MSHFATIFPPGDPARQFRDPAHLFDWLQNKRVEAEAKNTVLTYLLRAAIGNETSNALAVELLLLALWPGLCVIRHRLRAVCSTFTLDADLIGSLTTGILSAQPDRITRVAATLLRNLERDLLRGYIREIKKPLSAIDLAELGPARQAQELPETILSAAQDALGQDGVLLAAVHIAGFSQKEAAKQLGISHEAARKRCQRALRHLAQNKNA